MRTSISACFLIAVILFVSILPIEVAYGEDVEADVVAGEFLVGLKKVDEEIIALIEEDRFEVVRRIEQINVILVKVRDNVTTKECTEALASIPTVKYVEPNRLVGLPPIKLMPVIEASMMDAPSKVEVVSTPNDPLWYSDSNTGLGQWNMRLIGADRAWDIQRGSYDVIVAIIDSGVYGGHLDLQTNYLPGGYDWVNDDDDPNDDYGHGSWVAGIVAAETDNGYGVAGLAQVSIIAEKILGRGGTGTIADAISGLVHAADLGVDIINMSFGTYSYSVAFADAVNYAYSRGCFLVAAAGNDNTDSPHYPSAFENVIAVASTYGEPNDIRAPYSNSGSWITVSAPGGYDENGNGSPNTNEHWVLSTYNRQDVFAIGFGTSAATPHVSGLAALYKSQYPTVTNEEIYEVLKNTAVDKGDSGWDELYGYGRIDAYRALRSSLITSVGGEGEIISLHPRSTVASWISFTILMYLALIFISITNRSNVSISSAREKRTK